MWFPKPVYDVLPYLYVLIGGIAILNVDHPIGVLSGGVLLGIGLIIQMARRKNRARRVASGLK